jgi:UDP-N-acetylmuramate--alanine ligase
VNNKHIHFIGIGGIGMSAIAQILLQGGNRISGSDLKENSITDKLKGLGARIHIGHHKDNIKDADAVVYSSAIKSDNPEITAAIERHIPVLKRAQLLQELMEDKKSITVAGAHGKTTTTSMISCLLTSAGLNPTVATGGVVCTSGTNAWTGDGKYFVAELDESDGSFLYFHPFISVVTNIDYEHVDYYGDWHSILTAYEKFIYQTQKDGWLFACGDDFRLREILNQYRHKKMTFGLAPDNDVHASNIRLEKFSSQFTCVCKNKKMGDIALNVFGSHNVSNSLAAVCVGLELGIDFDRIKEGLAQYRGVQRRFQVKHQINDVIIIEDYGHHPTEIKVTLEAARSVGPHRLVVVFQPHRYTRTKLLLEEFGKSFTNSDYLIVTDIYAASEAPIEGVSGENISEKVKASGHKQAHYLKKDKIIENLLKVVKPQDLVIFLGAGDIGRMTDELAEELKKNS